jgi:hypothetical protein
MQSIGKCDQLFFDPKSTVCLSSSFADGDKKDLNYDHV